MPLSLAFWLIWNIIQFIPSLVQYFNFTFSVKIQTTCAQNTSEVIYSLPETKFSHKFRSIYHTETQKCELVILTAFTLLKLMKPTGFQLSILTASLGSYLKGHKLLYSLSFKAVRAHAVSLQTTWSSAKHELSLNGVTTLYKNVPPVWLF